VAVGGIVAQAKKLRAGDVLVRRSPVWYGVATRLFDRLERAPLDERRAWTDDRLRAVLAGASRTEYGRRVSAATSVGDWPILEKDSVRVAPGAFVRGSTWIAAPGATSGTSGKPLDVWRSFRSVAVEQAAVDAIVARLGVRLRASKVAVLRGDDIKDPGDSAAPFWVPAAGGRRLVFSSNHLSAETVPAFAAALTEFEPDVLHAYPTILGSLCSLLRSSGARVSIPVCLCSSELLSDELWQLAADVLGSRLVDCYGLAERVSFAYAFQAGTYRFLAGYSYNELIPCGSDGDTDVYELVATGLWNLKMPLVRYRTGDLVRLRAGSDPIAVAYGAEPFLGVVGRMDDYLVAPDGARLMGIDHIPRGIRNVEQMQVIQERRDAVRVLVVPADLSAGVDRRAIRANAARKLPPTMSVSVEVASELERSPSGKIPFVVRRAGL
jgi:phenylacetate-CoA ligase